MSPSDLRQLRRELARALHLVAHTLEALGDPDSPPKRTRRTKRSAPAEPVTEATAARARAALRRAGVRP